MKKKKGISLIVLIVTIIVIIILAAAVILTISKNNPVDSAKEATFKEDVRNFQDDLSLSVSKDYTQKAGKRDSKFNATTFDKIKEYIPSFTNKYEGKFAIIDDQLIAVGSLSKDEEKWLDDFGVTIGMTAKNIDSSIYGKEICNYQFINKDVEEKGVKWKLFYSDESNIYLISADYIDESLFPEKDGIKTIHTSDQFPKAGSLESSANTILEKYPKSIESIGEDMLKKYNKSYYNYIIDNNISKDNVNKLANIRGVAHMLDKEIWTNLFKDSNGKAEYVIGGPSLELLFNSYNKKYYNGKEKYKVKTNNYVGCQVSSDFGNSYASGISENFDLNDTLYVLPSSNGANAMWIASPSSYIINAVYFVKSDGSVAGDYRCLWDTIGFRPVVCLNSSVKLKLTNDGKLELR